MKLDKTDIKLIAVALAIITLLIVCIIYAVNYTGAPKPQPTIATGEQLETYAKHISEYYTEEELTRA